jgi:hypothetical protein
MTGFCAVFHPQSEHFEQAWAVLAGKSDSSGRLPVSPSQWSGADIEHVWGGHSLSAQGTWAGGDDDDGSGGNDDDSFNDDVRQRLQRRRRRRQQRLQERQQEEQHMPPRQPQPLGWRHAAPSHQLEGNSGLNSVEMDDKVIQDREGRDDEEIAVLEQAGWALRSSLQAVSTVLASRRAELRLLQAQQRDQAHTMGAIRSVVADKLGGAETTGVGAASHGGSETAGSWVAAVASAATLATVRRRSSPDGRVRAPSAARVPTPERELSPVRSLRPPDIPPRMTRATLVANRARKSRVSVGRTTMS